MPIIQVTVWSANANLKEATQHRSKWADLAEMYLLTQLISFNYLVGRDLIIYSKIFILKMYYYNHASLSYFMPFRFCLPLFVF